MEFEYLGRKFVLVELVNPFKNETLDIVQIMEIVDEMKYKFINYFYGVPSDFEDAVEIAKEYISEVK